MDEELRRLLLDILQSGILTVELMNRIAGALGWTEENEKDALEGKEEEELRVNRLFYP